VLLFYLTHGVSSPLVTRTKRRLFDLAQSAEGTLASLALRTPVKELSDQSSGIGYVNLLYGMLIQITKIRSRCRILCRSKTMPTPAQVPFQRGRIV
jgi:hypothetical protein